MQDSNTEQDIIVSFEGVKMKDFRAYWSAVGRGDWKGQDEFFAKVVTAWVYDLDPSQPESYGELSVSAYNKVQVAIRRANQVFVKQLR